MITVHIYMDGNQPVSKLKKSVMIVARCAEYPLPVLLVKKGQQQLFVGGKTLEDLHGTTTPPLDFVPTLGVNKSN